MLKPLALPCSIRRFDTPSEESRRHRPLECVVCGQYTRTRCVACSVAFYCSKTCQAEDWTIHSGQCSALALKKRRRREGVSLMLPGGRASCGA
eukprot:4329955-Prymnesium_polylepis.2